MVANMFISSKQKRFFTLAIQLSSGKAVSAKAVIENLECSGATLTRCLRELRERYSATIKFSKANNSYHMTDTGTLTKKDLRQMAEYLKKDDESEEIESVVSLTRVKKKAITLSLSKVAISKIDRAAKLRNSNRSDTIEQLIQGYIGSLTSSDHEA